MAAGFPNGYVSHNDFKWAKDGTSVQGAVYEVTRADLVNAAIRMFLLDDGRVADSTSPEGMPISLKKGERILCTKNQLDDAGRIWFGRCEYVVVDADKEGRLTPRKDGVFRCTNPLDKPPFGEDPKKFMNPVRQICPIEKSAFKAICAEIYKARTDEPNGLWGRLACEM